MKDQFDETLTMMLKIIIKDIRLDFNVCEAVAQHLLGEAIVRRCIWNKITDVIAEMIEEEKE